MYTCVQPLKEEIKKETALSENELKEDEKLGRLHFTLDYNFTENTVSFCWSVRLNTICQLKNVTFEFFFFNLVNYPGFPAAFCHRALAGGGRPGGFRASCNGRGRQLRPICEALPAPRQKEKI